MIPACGQGAIGIEVRNEKAITGFVSAINHQRTYQEISIERDLLARIGGGCHMPVGIHAVISGNTVKLYISMGNRDNKITLHNLYAGNSKNTEALISKVFLKTQGIPK
jgi:hydroxymethylbilane synthase